MTEAAAPQGELAYQVMAMPADANPAGDIFGGYIMGLMDLAGGISSRAFANGRVATVAVSHFIFHQPVKVGDVVCCYTRLLKAGRTSIALEIEAWVRRRGQGEMMKVTAAEFTFVSVDSNGRPTPLPQPDPAEAAAGSARHNVQEGER